MSIYVSAEDSIRRAALVYNENGVVVVQGLIPPEALRRLNSICLKVVQARGRSVGLPLPTNDLDEAFNALCEYDRSLGGNVYDCLKHHPEVVKLMTYGPLIEYIERFLDTQYVYYAADQIHFRIDRRGEEQFCLPWHQDLWWTNTSRHAITTWYSLVDVPVELGPMRFVLGSHREIAKVRIDPNFKVKWDATNLFKIATPVDESAAIDVPVKAGDVVFLNALVLHRSGTNQSPTQNRWTVVNRYAPLFDSEFVAKGWKANVRPGYASLLETHPNCIVNRDEIVEPDGNRRQS